MAKMLDDTGQYTPGAEAMRAKIRNACYHARAKFPEPIAAVLIDYLDSWTSLGHLFGGGNKVNEVVKALEEYETNAEPLKEVQWQSDTKGVAE